MPSGIYIRTEKHKNSLKVPHKGSGIYGRTEEHRKKIGEGLRGNKNMLGKHLSEKTKRKISEYQKKNPTKYWLGKNRPKETKIKMSIAHKGLGKGEKNGMWKGEKAGCSSKHCWINDNYGRPPACEHCQIGNLTGHKIHWANISGEYKRERTDWLRLCVKCHCLFDKQNKTHVRRN